MHDVQKDTCCAKYAERHMLCTICRKTHAVHNVHNQVCIDERTEHIQWPVQLCRRVRELEHGGKRGGGTQVGGLECVGREEGRTRVEDLGWGGAGSGSTVLLANQKVPSLHFHMVCASMIHRAKARFKVLLTTV